MTNIKIKRCRKMFGGSYNALFVNDVNIGSIDKRKKEIKYVYEVGYINEYFEAMRIFFENRELILKYLNMKYIKFYGWSVPN